MDHILFNTRLRLVYVILLCLLLGLFVPFILTSTVFSGWDNDVFETCALNTSYKFECVPNTPVIDKDMCNSLGCCYDINVEDSFAPSCFHTAPPKYRYTITNSTKSYLLGNKTRLNLYLKSEMPHTPYGDEIWDLQVLIQRLDNGAIRVKLWNESRVYVPEDDIKEVNDVDNLQLDVEVKTEYQSFSINVYRTVNKTPLFQTVFGPIIYGKNFMEISTRIPTSHLYGLGQRERGFLQLLPNYDMRTRWTLYNREYDPSDGSLYGSHPFYMNFENDGKIHGVYMKNSAPVEVGVLPIPAVVFRTIDSIFDFRIFPGPTPQDVSNQYTLMVGRPAMPPLWALGYHLCRTTSNDTEYERVAKVMESLGIPYESDCIDARLNYPDPFANLSSKNQERIQELKDSGRKFFMVQYPFVPVNSTGFDEDYLLKLPTNGTYYGLIEKQVVGYPDYCNENTFHDWLTKNKEAFLEADGVMLFENTPLNQVTLNYDQDSNGTSCNETHPEGCCPRDTRAFTPLGIEDINKGTICPVAMHTSVEASSLQLHNQYGRCHHQRIQQLMKELNQTKRQLVTSLSTHPGSGAFGGHFGGHYSANFVPQRKAQMQILEMGLYGVPLAGVPVCGSTDDADSNGLMTELCLRSHQTAAFWPFMMSHYDAGQTPRNPPDFTDGFATQLAYLIRQRYMMIPYMYTLFHKASQTGVPVVRPLFYEFPEDKGSRNSDRQFMLGDSLLVTPVFNSMQDNTHINVPARFPPAAWYNFYTGALEYSGKAGMDTELSTLLNDVHVHIKGGTIVPMQGNLHEIVTNTAEARMRSFHLLVALSTNTTTVPTTTTPASETTESSQSAKSNEEILASGDLYIDDGETELSDSVHTLEFIANHGKLSITRKEADCGEVLYTSTTIYSILVYGAPFVNKVTVDSRNGDYTQDADTGALHITNIQYNWCSTDTVLVTWE